MAEGCVICHGAGRDVDVAVKHDPPIGTVTAVINNAAFNAADNAVTIDFTFVVRDPSGNPVNVDLTEKASPTSNNLRYLRFTIARLVPAAAAGEPDSWFYYGPRSHRRADQLVPKGGNSYTYTFVDNVALDDASYTHRVGFELNIDQFVAAFPQLLRMRPVNPTRDWVPDGVTPLRSRKIVTIDACNGCHNPLGLNNVGTHVNVFHGGRRADTEYCVMCHNPNNGLAPQSAGGEDVPIPFVKLVHGIHGSALPGRPSQNLLIFENGDNHGDFTEVTYPQDIRNCTKCHRGGADSDNWKTKPYVAACQSCHVDVNFATGANHRGGPQSSNAGCTFCHPASGSPVSGFGRSVTDAHLTDVVTPNNPDLPAGLKRIAYFIDNVTVNSNNAAVVTFHITSDGAPLDLSTFPPAGFTGGPAFLVAYALPQDGIAVPVDYNNLGRSAGQPASISLADNSVRSSLTGSPDAYTVTLSSAPFPAGATLRAVALQGAFTQVTPTGNVSRHAPSVVKAVTGDPVRRHVVKSGYTNNDAVNGQPIGCLECHEHLALHGGSRVDENDVQICAICHNPNLSSSGRTIDPATQTISPDVIAAVGDNTLAYPEASMHFKNLIHGIHSSRKRTTDYEFVRNRTSGGLTGFYYNWSEVTFPGNLMDCTKCHIGDSYLPSSIPAGVLASTERTTTGNPAETQADIVAARNSVPNSTDLVNSPIASACYYCHDSSAAASHMVLNGGKIRTERTDVFLTFPAP